MNNFIINPDDKFYPQANDWMWDYCIFLGKFTDSEGKNYDLGIHISTSAFNNKVIRDVSNATVWSNEPGDYSSGSLIRYKLDEHDREDVHECYRRAKLLNLIK